MSRCYRRTMRDDHRHRVQREEAGPERDGGQAEEGRPVGWTIRASVLTQPHTWPGTSSQQLQERDPGTTPGPTPDQDRGGTRGPRVIQ